MTHKRWNGWGQETIHAPLAEPALAFLIKTLGPEKETASAPLDALLGSVPASRLPDHPLIRKDPETRLRHAAGQSLPDWIALRYGALSAFPDGVAFPASPEEVDALLKRADADGWAVIPYGGGTSVTGHINIGDRDRPVLTMDLGRMDRLLLLDEKSRLASFEGGVTGPFLEAQVRAHGYTLGHFPQSFEFSSLGGWIATRSAGQQSLHYGRIEDLFAGGTLISPKGILELPPFPASAAGPDLRHAVLGSEGRLGFLTRAVVRISALPEKEEFHGVFFPAWDRGEEALRAIVQDRIPVSMLRLSDAVETATTLLLAGHPTLVGLLERLLRVRGLDREKCMLIFGATGLSSAVKAARRRALDCMRAHGGIHVGRKMGSQWRKMRFRTPYLRNTLWEKGYAVDTLETAFTWTALARGKAAVEEAIRRAFEEQGESALCFSHLSHVYRSGAGVYFTVLFRLAPTAEETLDRWTRMKTAASRTLQQMGGTISHQHGVGLDHRPYLEGEKQALGMEMVSALAASMDPHGIMNPGKLIGKGHGR